MKEPRELQRLEDPENWDFDRAERRAGGKSGRVIVSVAFPRSDFDQVAECAEQLNMRTSEFIRESALERTEQHREQATISSFSGTLGSVIFTKRHLATTRISGTAGALGKESALTV